MLQFYMFLWLEKYPPCIQMIVVSEGAGGEVVIEQWVEISPKCADRLKLTLI